MSTAHLWLPILVSAIGVFFASSLIHMVIKWHNSDYRKLANEDDVRATLGRGNPSPGQYVVPHCMDMKQMQSPEMQKKFIEGPVGFVIIRPSGLPRMGGHLLKWFLLNLLIAAFAAHLGLPCCSDRRRCSMPPRRRRSSPTRPAASPTPSGPGGPGWR